MTTFPVGRCRDCRWWCPPAGCVDLRVVRLWAVPKESPGFSPVFNVLYPPTAYKPPKSWVYRKALCGRFERREGV